MTAQIAFTNLRIWTLSRCRQLGAQIMNGHLKDAFTATCTRLNPAMLPLLVFPPSLILCERAVGCGLNFAPAQIVAMADHTCGYN